MLLVVRGKLLAEVDVLGQKLFFMRFEAVQGYHHSVTFGAEGDEAEPFLRPMPAKIDASLKFDVWAVSVYVHIGLKRGVPAHSMHNIYVELHIFPLM